jgi:GT2 family glycosyltransferase
VTTRAVEPAATEDASPGACPEASVLIVTYRSEPWIARCLGALPAALSEHSHEVLVVDNASPDGTVGVIREQFPDVRLTEAGDNLGFGRAVNLAAASARGRWLVLLNPDTEPLPGSLDALLDFAASRPGAGIVGGRTLTEGGEVDPSSCWGTPTLWSRTCFALGLSTVFNRHPLLDPESLGGWDRDSVREVGMVTGCLAAVDRDVWQRVGGFDERFWMYGEDADLNLRLRALGFRPTITPAAEVVHAVGASAPTRGEKRVQVLRSKVTLDRLHAPRWQRRPRQLLLAFGSALRAAGERLGIVADNGWTAAWDRRHDWLRGYP